MKRISGPFVDQEQEESQKAWIFTSGQAVMKVFEKYHIHYHQLEGYFVLQHQRVRCGLESVCTIYGFRKST